MKSKPICFIHDSIEIDMHPLEVFPLIGLINYLFNVFPIEEFGVPVACDVPLGVSMGQECIVKEMKHDDSFNNIDITLNGYIDDICELVDLWATVYKEVKITDTCKDTWKSEYISSKLFLAQKSSVSEKTGTTRNTGDIRISVVVQ